MSRARKKPNRIKQFILWGLLATVVLCGGGALYGYLWLQNYLKSDAIRLLVQGRLAALGKGEANIASLDWSGPVAYTSTASVVPATPNGWSKMEAEGVQTTMDWSGIREGVWRVMSISADWLRIDLSAPPQAPATSAPTPVVPATESMAAAPASSPPAAGLSDAPAWLRAWLPTRTEIEKLEIAALQVAPPKGQPGVKLQDLRVVAKPANDAGAWELQGQGGTLALPGVEEAFKISSLRARLDQRALNINNAQGTWLGGSDVTARGTQPFEPGQPWKYTGSLSNLDLRHILAESWENKLRGILEADYEASSARLTAKVVVKNGVIENMPLLDRVADFTRTDRFRRVALEEARWEVEQRPEVTEIRQLVLQSSGLLRIEGDLTLGGQAIDGLLHVGVSNDALRWIPGAQTQVFTESRSSGPPGFVWTLVRVSGTREAPTEDLSNRLLAAMGKELINAPLKVAEKGVEVLGGAAGEPGKAATEMSKDVLKTTQDAAGQALETGAGLLKGMVPLFGQ